MTKFQFKTYRCEWVAEVYEVDQYDRRLPKLVGGKQFYEKPWPTCEEALADLEAVTQPHPNSTSRRVFPGAPHQYYSTGVRYREVEAS